MHAQLHWLNGKCEYGRNKFVVKKLAHRNPKNLQLKNVKDRDRERKRKLQRENDEKLLT